MGEITEETIPENAFFIAIRKCIIVTSGGWPSHRDL